MRCFYPVQYEGEAISECILYSSITQPTIGTSCWYDGRMGCKKFYLLALTMYFLMLPTKF